ncbi:MAG: hypothetical protein ACI8WB_003438 [Phenylobacterium sp.]|jgi:hypothetical protein
MTRDILTRPERDVTNLLALTKPTAQKNSETVQIVTIPKTTGELTS